MIKGLLKIGLLLVVGLLGYNYFLGDDAEQAQAKEIINKGKDLGKSAVDLVKAEKQKFDAGKYDGAVDRVGKLFENLKSKAEGSKEYLDKIKELEQKRDEIKARIEEDKAKGEVTQEETEALAKEMEALERETKTLGREIVNENPVEDK